MLNIENIDKNCCSWSKLAYLYPCKNIHPTRVSNYRQFFNESNIGGYDFTNRFECSDVQRFDKLNNLSIKKFEISFCRDHNNWKH